MSMKLIALQIAQLITIVVENGDTITNSSETIEGQVSVDSVKASI